MLIGQRLRELRESKKLSQGDIERRTGLLRCYTSRVENGHTVPNVETLEKYARALEVPIYRLFHDGSEPAKKPQLLPTDTAEWETTAKQTSELRSLTRSLARMSERDRILLLGMTQRIATRRRRRR